MILENFNENASANLNMKSDIAGLVAEGTNVSCMRVKGTHLL
jgi:hypothetical protein